MTDKEKAPIPGEGQTLNEGNLPTSIIPQGDEAEKCITKPYDVINYLVDQCRWHSYIQACYLILLRHRNKQTGLCYPSTRTIAEHMQVTPKVAISAVKSLEEAGAIVTFRRREPGTKEAAVNQYLVRGPWEAAKEIAYRPSWVEKKERLPDVLPDGNKVMPDGNKVIPDGQHSDTRREQRVMPDGNSNRFIEQVQLTSSDIDTSPPLKSENSPSTKPRKTPSATSEKKEPKPKDITQVLAEKLDLLLREYGQQGLESGGDWKNVRGKFKRVVGGAGAIPIPEDEALETLEWVFADQKRRAEFKPEWLRSTWSKWQERDKAPKWGGRARHGAPDGHVERQPGLSW